jgi:hypothetical protein
LDGSSDSVGFKRGEDLFFSVEGLGSGVSGLRGMVKDGPVAVDIPAGNEAPGRAEQTTYRVLRDTRLARQLKLLHRDRCQLCGETLRISEAMTYSENGAMLGLVLEQGCGHKMILPSVVKLTHRMVIGAEPNHRPSDFQY